MGEEWPIVSRFRVRLKARAGLVMREPHTDLAISVPLVMQIHGICADLCRVRPDGPFQFFPGAEL
jgi:hypothetical protein